MSISTQFWYFSVCIIKKVESKNRRETFWLCWTEMSTDAICYVPLRVYIDSYAKYTYFTENQHIFGWFIREKLLFIEKFKMKSSFIKIRQKFKNETHKNFVYAFRCCILVPPSKHHYITAKHFIIVKICSHKVNTRSKHWKWVDQFISLSTTENGQKHSAIKSKKLKQ